MKCPHCGKELDVADRCFMNVDSYGRMVMAKTECCGKGVYISPIRKYNISAYTGPKKEDDWGLKLSK